MWFELVVVGSDASAAIDRGRVAAEMTPQQIAKAQKMAREFTALNFPGIFKRLEHK